MSALNAALPVAAESRLFCFASQGITTAARRSTTIPMRLGKGSTCPKREPRQLERGIRALCLIQIAQRKIAVRNGWANTRSPYTIEASAYLKIELTIIYQGRIIRRHKRGGEWHFERACRDSFETFGQSAVWLSSFRPFLSLQERRHPNSTNPFVLTKWRSCL